MTAGITTDLPTQANIQRNNFPLRNSTSLVMSQFKKKKKIKNVLLPFYLLRF